MPRSGLRAAVVGSGIVGLSTAWFLQDEGFEVTVFDRRDVAAGASAGNAGWICPAMVAPLAEPSVLRYGLASLFRRDSPLLIAPGALPATWLFLLAFAAHCTHRQWLAGVASYAQLNGHTFASYQALADGGVTGAIEEAAVVAAFETPAQAAPLRRELRTVAAAGQDFSVDELSEVELRREQPLLGSRTRYGLRIGGQKFLQPLPFTQSLAASVTRRGGQIIPGAHVSAVSSTKHGVQIDFTAGTADFDVCVLANGAWITELARPAGIRVRVQAGRGYSFTVRTPEPMIRPLYIPAMRVACTPAPGGMRVAGTMEFKPADDPLDQRRIHAIVRTAQDFLPGVDWSTLAHTWVGPRPVTADGLPIIGRTKTENVFCAGGHGMWGMTLGPATGHLLARVIATGRPQTALAPFDPLRLWQYRPLSDRDALPSPVPPQDLPGRTPNCRPSGGLAGGTIGRLRGATGVLRADHESSPVRAVSSCVTAPAAAGRYVAATAAASALSISSAGCSPLCPYQDSTACGPPTRRTRSRAPAAT
jgi:D-amino-acid dehydrogenase